MVEETLKLAYGENSDLIKDKRIAAVQALSGTGACRLFADFQKRFSPDSKIYIPAPTWSKLVITSQNAPNGSFFLLHACAHNPTGVDPTEEQWKEISHQFKVKGHFAFFDMAYQGFASGDPERDARSIRIFLEDGHQIVCEDEKQAVAVKSQLQQIARPMYSNPPVHGALIVSTILSDPDLKSLWLKEVKVIY
ncbi:aspartate aminotransferase mitochondrial [Phtheirospermum japonicum]|uniref:Aspartate aminotransferase mitochondrial n=1 Tax=Phtheirospermum japonicum TaxID=374723 RepID=A0A830B3D7_9LAMI|nr:aspartate aminotransferase mitochondrial [Phtheirospermum japonicum]